MRVVLASDHAGIELRQAVAQHLESRGVTVLDLGPHEPTSVDYPTYAQKAAETVRKGDAELGIVVCGTGIGVSMAANRVPSIRAALCTNAYMAAMARAHNDANILCMGQRVVGPGLAVHIVDTFLDTAFEGGRHQRRVELLTDMER